MDLPAVATTAGDPPPAAGADFAVAAPRVELPKGGGAIRGIGEKFAANPVTGTGSLTVPHRRPAPAASGFGPQLVAVVRLRRRQRPVRLRLEPVACRRSPARPTRACRATTTPTESDVFVLSGAEDLVPVLDADGEPRSRTARDGAGLRDPPLPAARRGAVRPHRALDQRRDAATSHWRSISRDNVTTLYGRTRERRIADPADPRARLQLADLRDATTTRATPSLYEYKAEDGAGVDLAPAHERNRGDATTARTANRYLKRIRYGNRAPLLDRGLAPRIDRPRRAGRLDVRGRLRLRRARPATTRRPDDAGPWPCRRDPFSTYRAGFEVRTYRLCQRVLMFHHFPDEPGVGADCLVRSTDFAYSHERDPADARDPDRHLPAVASPSPATGAHGGGYLQAQPAAARVRVHASPIVQDDGAGRRRRPAWRTCPTGLDGARYQWVDLDGEGVSGRPHRAGRRLVLQAQPQPGRRRGRRRVRAARAGRAASPTLGLAGGRRAVARPRPATASSTWSSSTAPAPGFYERDDARGLGSRSGPFAARPNRDIARPEPAVRRPRPATATPTS